MKAKSAAFIGAVVIAGMAAFSLSCSNESEESAPVDVGAIRRRAATPSEAKAPAQPNAAVTYTYNGTKHDLASGKIGVVAGEEFRFFQETLEPLRKEKKWEDLAKLCEEQMAKTPEWLTPFYYSGLALANMGKINDARERLRFVIDKANGDPQYAEAEILLKTLQSF